MAEVLVLVEHDGEDGQEGYGVSCSTLGPPVSASPRRSGSGPGRGRAAGSGWPSSARPRSTWADGRATSMDYVVAPRGRGAGPGWPGRSPRRAVLLAATRPRAREVAGRLAVKIGFRRHH